MTLLRFLGALGAVGILALACGTSGSSGADQGSAPSSAATSCSDLVHLAGNVNDKGAAAIQGSASPVEVNDIFFSPTCLTGATGSVTLTLTNKGKLLHNISIPDQAVDIDIAPGQTVTVQIKVAGQPVQFFCKYHKDSGQQGALVPAK